MVGLENIKVKMPHTGQGIGQVITFERLHIMVNFEV